MKGSFCLSVLVSVFSTISLYASESGDYNEHVPLLETDGFDMNFQYNNNFAFSNPRSTGNLLFSESVSLDRICQFLKAGSALGAEYAHVKKRGRFEPKQYLAFFENDTWVAKKAETGSEYVSKIYCSEPSREYALKLLSHELNKSKGGSKVDINLFKKLHTLYPDLLTVELARKFLVAEQRHRFQRYVDEHNTLYSSRNYNENFVRWLVGVYPELKDDIGPY